MPHTTHDPDVRAANQARTKRLRATAVAAAAIGALAVSPTVATAATPSAHNATGGLSAFAQSGGRLTMRGVAYDPDYMPHGVRVNVYVNGRLSVATTSQARSYLWGADLFLAPGSYRIQVDAVNVGAGSSVTLITRTIVVPGHNAAHDPRGGLTGFALAGQRLVLRGIAYDPDTMPHGQGVLVYINGRLATSTVSQARSYRWGKDINLPAGRFLIQVVVVNSFSGANVNLISRWVSVAAPVGAWQLAYSGSQRIAAQLLPAFGWGPDQMAPLIALWNRESGWNPRAGNSSGAYGIPQALPGSKMASAGADWATNPATQIRWGLSYIKGVYGSPAAAWAHSQATGWY